MVYPVTHQTVVARPLFQKCTRFAGDTGRMSGNWPTSTVYDINDLAKLTRALSESRNGVNDSLRAMSVLGLTKGGLWDGLVTRSQSWSTGSAAYQERTAQQQLLPAARALGQFFTTMAGLLERSLPTS